ncbi:hypothetical protein HIM_06010 [Hirsutella minnesotensis 3608]|uniref:Uncharacterized protein n=1 Tax=Hirsutella minnesotensis 3608 TaxID=1043627 RepID=A0A0F7ZP05_9HYPO|nr:hypothetical protein HIM_06010 [Hirsutella minnesotensis 3608]
MQAVPSLVGTGTAVAAAATGLVFGQQSAAPTAPTIFESSPARTLRRSHKRTVSVDNDLESDYRSVSNIHHRPATTSASPSAANDYAHHRAASHSQASRPPLSRHQRPQSSQVPLSRPFHRRLSLARQPEELPLASQSSPRDSGSSNGSWIKRFSMRPQSQQGSPRSSLYTDTNSVDFSNRSAAVVQQRPSTTASSLPPNKLVKRSLATQNHGIAADHSPRRRPGAHLPTFRRPATSHQRSATLQQFRAEIDVAGSIIHSKYPVEQPIWPEELLGAPPFHEQLPSIPRADPAWESYFHNQTTRVPASSSLQSRVGDASSPTRNSSSKRIQSGSSIWRGGAYLMKPKMISHLFAPGSITLAPATLEEESDRSITPGNVPPTRTRRSLSASLSSASSWVTRRSGSLRRQKRTSDQPGSVAKRHVSEPTEAPSQSIVDRQEDNRPADKPENVSPVTKPLADSLRVSAGAPVQHQHASHQRRTSSPLSTFSVIAYSGGDVSRANGHCRVGSNTRHPRPNQPSGSSTSSAAMSQLARGSNHDRLSVMDSSDGDARGFTSGDDDDYDFRSDTIFDSLRTHSSCRAKAVETPLESVYDESPPSTAGHARNKRLSAQEMLVRGWDDDNKIMEEEDESMPSPSRTATRVGFKDLRDHTAAVTKPETGNDKTTEQVSRSFEACSLGDTFDDDEDWTRDENEQSSATALSPCSKGDSVRTKGINPNVRIALAGLDEENPPQARHYTRLTERPMSNIFEWSEPPTYDKQDCAGTSVRPRTSYAMPEMDSRGGRSAIRRGPTPMHVRSQSVPVVHELVDNPKPTGPKYGTWGMATKTVSEDWDEDFEFGVGADAGDGKATDKSQETSFAVPESIRATQPSVRAHSGQIRELSLLVNDLKRLCRHGRELGMLNGEQMALWREAEGIIALASPDEDDGKEGNQASSPIDLDAFDAKRLSSDGRLDSSTFESIKAVVESPAPAMRKTAVVRERQSPRRRSVFSPEDDIFGGSWPATEDGSPKSSRSHQPRTPDGRSGTSKDVTGAVKSVKDSVHHNHRSSTESPRESRSKETGGRVHFDTNSLKALVKRAGELRDSLSDMVRRADQITQSPAATPKRERRLDSSPAFTRVFDDPGSSPPRRSIKSRGNNSAMETTASTERPPSSPMSSQVPLMTVS